MILKKNEKKFYISQLRIHNNKYAVWQLLKIFHKLLYGFFIYSTGDSGNLPMKKLKILKHINIFNLHKKIIILLNA